MKSGEWLRGEIHSLDDDELKFESEELDDLTLDWADVSEVRTKRVFTVLLSDQQALTGVLTVDGSKVSIAGTSGTTEHPRGDVFRMVPGVPKEANYWSGKVGLSIAAHSGNTDQSDVAYSMALLRETAASRLPISAVFAYSEVDSTETENKKQFDARYDRFLGPRLFVTPLGLEFVEDRFQNIDRRITPFTGLGYTVVDRKKWNLDVTSGVGYRFTRFDSVAAGEDRDQSEATAVFGSKLGTDLTNRVELDAAYTASVSMKDASDTIQGLDVTLSVDLWKELELDVKFAWDRVGRPEEDSGGDTPDRNDYQLLVGLVWAF